jgi:threonylcarbamoyladenosine tRNA methylthiotransferase MtaB
LQTLLQRCKYNTTKNVVYGKQKKKVAFYTLGCKLNFSETSTIARNFQDEGFDRVDFEEVADMYVINTCSVTENATSSLNKWSRKQ